jgi:hypothetical protein
MVCTREAGCNAPPLAPNSRNMPSPVWNLTIGKVLPRRREWKTSTPACSRQFRSLRAKIPANCKMEKGLLSLSLLPLPSLESHWMQGHSHEPGGVMG